MLVQATQEASVVVVAEQVQGASALTTVSANAPACVLTPRVRSQTAWACLGSLGGGLVMGDIIRSKVVVRPGARLLVSTQASTKVYRGDKRCVALQTLSAHVESDGFLAVLPDPVTCFAQARYQQEQSLHVAPGASAVFLDWFTSGRAARAERWAFDLYQSSLHLYDGERLALWDATRLTPNGPRNIMQRMGRFDVMGTLVFWGPKLTHAGDNACQTAQATPIGRRKSFVWTALPIANSDHGATLVRFASHDIAAPQALIQQLLQPCAELLGGTSPWERRGI